MNNRRRRPAHTALVFVLSTAITLWAEPIPQNTQNSDQAQPSQVPDANQQQQPASNSGDGNAAVPPLNVQLPDAPTPAQPAQSGQNDSTQQQNPNAVPSGAAGAKAPAVKGAPAAQPVGAAIAPAKQRQRRSLLIKAGLIAGACVAVGSAFALSKASPSKPPGAP